MSPWALLLLWPAVALGQAADAWQPRGEAELTALDKVRAQAVPLSVKVGDKATFGSLTVAVKSCLVRPADQAQDATAFLEITDGRPGAPGFRGWMVLSAPSVSMFEHPIYDVRLQGCK